MMPRKATVSALYNGVNATAQLAPDLASFTYTDVASGESDSIDLEINDRQRKWIGPWFPAKGDRIQPTIQTENWDAEGERKEYPCGSFGVDDYGFKGGPIQLSLKALALPVDSNFKTTDRTETYEATTLQQIGQIIADRAGIALYFEAPDLSIEKVEQNKQNDCDFYNGLVKKYGLALKIYNDRLVVFSEAAYEAAEPKLVLTERDFEPDWTWDTKTTGTYTGVRYQYTNSEKNLTFTVTAGGGDRILTCNEAAENLTEATAIALAAVNEANKDTTTLQITMKARPGLIATDCVEIKGLGKLSGKYYAQKVESSVGGGYKMALTLRKVETRFTEPSSVSSTVAEQASQ